MSQRGFQILLFFVCLIFLSFAQGCQKLKSNKPLLMQEEYERMLVGDLNANYVGTENCLAACHVHDELKKHFDASTMGVQMSGESGMPLLDCETCHGPGSLAVEGLTKELVEENARKGITTACDYNKLIDLGNLPAPAQSLVCLNCHSANATFNLHNWNTGIHARNDVSCFNCHDVHHSPDLKVTPIESVDLCLKCHEAVRVEFTLENHHPVPEGRVFCIDCHDQHGGVSEPLLKKDSVKSTCIQCHPDKKGPFLYEHADVMEDCINCHRPHGSINPDLLQARQPFLCLQCHEGHRINERSGRPIDAEHAADFFTRCTDCHSMIHGSDVPSVSGEGRFTR